jgi:endonuclease III-like uncharacterized protein
MKTLEKKINEDLRVRDTEMKELFEQEKQSFLKAIQENISVLDQMLKEYARGQIK